MRDKIKTMEIKKVLKKDEEYWKLECLIPKKDIVLSDDEKKRDFYEETSKIFGLIKKIGIEPINLTLKESKIIEVKTHLELDDDNYSYKVCNARPMEELN